MCGILGSISNNEIDFDDALSMLNHRGPDNKSKFSYKNLNLGHTRLSIIDLDKKSNQPFICGDYILIFNGEIYNYLSLKKILLKNGVEFNTNSDTEVLLKWIIKKGIKSIDHVEGMFAFALFNKKSEELILCRDPLGIKQLYVYNKDNYLIFSSEIKSIFKIDPKLKIIDRELFAEFFLNGFIYEPETGFKNIRKILPGTFEIYNLDSQKIKEKNYWNLSHNLKMRAPSNEEINNEIIKSINNHLVSDVPLGLFFSGGIDSSIILSQTLSKISAFTVKTDKKNYDNAGVSNDYKYALHIAKYLDIKLNSIEILDENLTNNQFLKLIEETAIYNEELISDFTFQSSKLLSKKVREKNYTVMLSGMGADEIFGGYPRYRLIKFEKLYFLLKMLKPILKKIKFFEKKIDRFFNYFKEDKFAFKYSSLIGYFSRDDILKLLNSDTGISKYLNKINLFLSKVQEKSNLKKAMYLDFYGFLSHNFTVADRSSMINSIELRVPLATKNLYELAWSSNDKELIDIFYSKKPLRNFLVKHLPKKLIDRKKAGFNAPLDNNIRKLGKKNVLKVLKNNNVFDVLDEKYITKILDKHYNMGSNNTYQIYQILHFSYWFKNYS